jgi:riboflavin transporter FmnP
MALKNLYLALAVAGSALPFWQLLPFLQEHGLDIPLLFARLFADPVAAFFGTDVIVSSVVLWVLVFAEGRRARMKQLWIPIVANLVVGVSLGLPLFLYMREIRLRARH